MLPGTKLWSASVTSIGAEKTARFSMDPAIQSAIRNLDVMDIHKQTVISVMYMLIETMEETVSVTIIGMERTVVFSLESVIPYVKDVTELRHVIAKDVLRTLEGTKKEPVDVYLIGREQIVQSM